MSLMICIQKQIAHKVGHPQAKNSGAMEKLALEIPTPNSHTLTIANWLLPPMNSHHLQRTGMSLSELQPGTKVTCTYLNVHYAICDQTANSNARGKYLENAVMDASSTFLNDREQPTRQDPVTGAFSSPDGTIAHAAF